ncbi:hypothetical protein AABM38_23860 [Heyndrickxia sp. MSNUG]|uniref:hypothetical protein n=1 Tax=Heyndrickxia sp. MSNUG TaxID=3136677 RepID=UPI003C2F1477
MVQNPMVDEVDEEINEIVNRLETMPLIILGYQNDKVHRIQLHDIYYFEAVDGMVFSYFLLFLRHNLLPWSKKLLISL